MPVLAGDEQAVFAARSGLADDDCIFPRIPTHLDVHSYWQAYAHALYLAHAPSRALPPTEGRLKPSDDDQAAAYEVTLALGHTRIDVVLRQYLR